MRLPRISSVLVFLLTCFGCGSLRVEMAVINPTYVQDEVCRLDVQLDLPDILAADDRVLNQSVLDLQNAHLLFYQQLENEYAREAEEREDEDLQFIADTLLPDFFEAITPVYTDSQEKLALLDARIRELAAARYEALDNDKISDARLIEQRMCAPLKERRARLGYLQRFVAEDTDGRIVGWAEEGHPIPEALVQSANVVVDQSRKLPTQRSLIAKPEAFAVANAPDDHWAEMYNRVLGRGRLGNVNVAVKMRSDGNFTIKGVTFDPSDVARVASKVTVQTLALASQIAGVPVTTNTQGLTAGVALAGSSNDLAVAKEELATNEAKVADYERALLTIANSLLRESEHIEGSDSERERAIAAIKATFDAHKSRLSVAVENAGGSSQ